jgi:hypothetical protein
LRIRIRMSYDCYQTALSELYAIGPVRAVALTEDEDIFKQLVRDKLRWCRDEEKRTGVQPKELEQVLGFMAKWGVEVDV